MAAPIPSWSGPTLPDAHISFAPLANQFVPRFDSPHRESENEQCSSTWGGSATSAGKKGGRFSGPSDGSRSGRRARAPARRRPRGRGPVRTVFAQPHVTPEEMIATAVAHTAELVEGLHVLAIQDTTTLRDDGDQVSLNLHAMIAVDAGSGAMLGPVHAEFLRHEGGKKGDCGKRPFEEKESFRWLTATREAAKLVEAGAAASPSWPAGRRVKR